MTIRAKYEDGVFKNLEDVKLAEDTKVEVHVPAKSGSKRRYVADRDDIPDGVTYVNRLRAPRY